MLVVGEARSTSLGLGAGTQRCDSRLGTPTPAEAEGADQMPAPLAGWDFEGAGMSGRLAAGWAVRMYHKSWLSLNLGIDFRNRTSDICLLRVYNKQHVLSNNHICLYLL